MTVGHSNQRKQQQRNPRMKKEHLAQREQALLTAALNCFATERCEDVTVARIAKLAGVAKGTVYLHFKSKDEICARLAGDFYNSLADKYAEINGDGAARLKKIVSISFNHYLELDHYRHIVQYCQRVHFLQDLNVEISESLQSIVNTRRQHIAKALELGSRDKTMAGNAQSKLTGISCTLDGALHHFQMQTIMEPLGQNEFIDKVTHYILTSVGHSLTPRPADEAKSLSPELIAET